LNRFLDTFLEPAAQWHGSLTVQVPEIVNNWVDMMPLLRLASAAPGLQIKFVDLGSFFSVREDLHNLNSIVKSAQAQRHSSSTYPLCGFRMAFPAVTFLRHKTRESQALALFVFEKSAQRAWMDGVTELQLNQLFNESEGEVQDEIDGVLSMLGVSDEGWVVRATIEGQDSGVKAKIRQRGY
jgi:hypothetical protein